MREGARSFKPDGGIVALKSLLPIAERSSLDLLSALTRCDSQDSRYQHDPARASAKRAREWRQYGSVPKLRGGRRLNQQVHEGPVTALHRASASEVAVVGSQDSALTRGPPIP